MFLGHLKEQIFKSHYAQGWCFARSTSSTAYLFYCFKRGSMSGCSIFSRPPRGNLANSIIQKTHKDFSRRCASQSRQHWQHLLEKNCPATTGCADTPSQLANSILENRVMLIVRAQRAADHGTARPSLPVYFYRDGRPLFGCRQRLFSHSQVMWRC